MPRYADRVYCDTAHNGGWFFEPAWGLGKDSANLALTRNALGDWSLNRTAGGAETYNVSTFPDMPRRILESYQAEGAFQEQFNLGNPMQGRLPFTAAQLAAGAPANPPAKGIQIDDVVVVYSVGVAALTSITPSFNEIIYANNVAESVVNIPLAAAPVLAVATQAQPYVTKIPILAPKMIVDDLSNLVFEVQFVMQNTGTLKVFGFGMHYHFNYN